MDRLARRLKRRIEKLERELAAVPAPMQPKDMARLGARMMELCDAALAGREPENLTEEERELLDQLVEYAPVYLELLAEGARDSYHDNHGGLADEDHGGER